MKLGQREVDESLCLAVVELNDRGDPLMNTCLANVAEELACRSIEAATLVPSKPSGKTLLLRTSCSWVVNGRTRQPTSPRLGRQPGPKRILTCTQHHKIRIGAYRIHESLRSIG